MQDERLPIRRIGDGFDRWDDLLALILDAFAYMGPLIDPPSSALGLTAASLVEKARSEFAFAAFDGDPDALYVGKLAVSHAVRGQGLGRRLMDEAEGCARVLGLPALRLQTRIELTANHRTFERWGFVRTGETAHPGYNRPTTVEMSRPVAPRRSGRPRP